MQHGTRPHPRRRSPATTPALRRQGLRGHPLNALGRRWCGGGEKTNAHERSGGSRLLCITNEPGRACCFRHQKVFWLDFAACDTLDLKGLGQTHPAGAIEPVVHLALADRWLHQAPEGRLGDAVFLEVVAEFHLSIMDHSTMDLQVPSIPFVYSVLYC